MSGDEDWTHVQGAASFDDDWTQDVARTTLAFEQAADRQRQPQGMALGRGHANPGTGAGQYADTNVGGGPASGKVNEALAADGMGRGEGVQANVEYASMGREQRNDAEDAQGFDQEMRNVVEAARRIDRDRRHLDFS